jgi:hypothetical protein
MPNDRRPAVPSQLPPFQSVDDDRGWTRTDDLALIRCEDRLVLMRRWISNADLRSEWRELPVLDEANA